MLYKYRKPKTLVPKQDAKSRRDAMWADLKKIALKRRREEEQDALRLQKLSTKLED